MIFLRMSIRKGKHLGHKATTEKIRRRTLAIPIYLLTNKLKINLVLIVNYTVPHDVLNVYCCRHEVPVTCQPITIVHMDEDIVVVNKPASIPVSGHETAIAVHIRFSFLPILFSTLSVALSTLLLGIRVECFWVL